MRNILVTAISGDIGNGIVKILRDTDCRLYGSDINEIAVGMDNVDEFWTCKPASDKDYIQEMLEYCKKNQITHLIPVNEREIESISKNREVFENAGIKLIIQSQKVLDICLDKLETSRYLDGIGLCVPRVIESREQIEANRTYIVKPRKSNGSKGLQICPGSEIEETCFSETSIIQEYIEGDEYTVGIFKNREVVNSIVFKRKLKNGYSNYVELTKDTAIDEIINRIARELDFDGYINLQMRNMDGQYYIFEINPRISGTVRFRHLLGFEDVIWWLNCLDNIPTPRYECKYEKAVGVRELNEKYLIME